MCQTWLFVLCASFMISACQDTTSFESEGTPDGGDANTASQISGAVWGTNEECCGQAGSVDPIHLQLVQLTDSCGTTTPTIYPDDCEGYYNSGENYEFNVSQGGCFRFLAEDGSGFYRIDSVIEIDDGESFLYNVEPVCVMWDCFFSY